MYDTVTHASPNFLWLELDPKGTAGPGTRALLHRLANDVLEPIRAHFGKPVHVTSGYRSFTLQTQLWEEALVKYGTVALAEEHVAPPGHSQHELGNAADVWIDGVTPAEIAEFAATLPTIGGIGVYADFCHVDDRPREDGVIARW